MADGAAAENRVICGRPKRQGDRGPCQKSAGWGTSHLGSGPCKNHGGTIPNVVMHHEAKLADERARTLFGVIVDVKPIENPLEVYAEFAGKVVSWMRTIESLVADLMSPRYEHDRAAEQIRGEVQLFERAMDRCNTVLSTYAKLNIDERLSRITEAQQFMVVQAIEAALAAADVTGARAIEAKKAAARRLRVAA